MKERMLAEVKSYNSRTCIKVRSLWSLRRFAVRQPSEMPDKQTAVTVNQFNADDPVKAVEVHTDFPVPAISDKEVLVKVTCRPVNPADILSCQGVYPPLHRDLPSVPGIEGVGIVEEIGKSVQKKLSKGQRVVGVPFPLSKKNGTLCSWCCPWLQVDPSTGLQLHQQCLLKASGCGAPCSGLFATGPSPAQRFGIARLKAP